MVFRRSDCEESATISTSCFCSLIVSANGAQVEAAECAFNVTVLPAAHAIQQTHHFVAVFNVTHSYFRNQVRHAIGLLRALAAYYGDADTRQIAATFVQPVGHIDADPTSSSPPRRQGRLLLFAWCNKTLAQSRPEESGTQLPLPVYGAAAKPSRFVMASDSGASGTFQDGCPAVDLRRLLFKMLDYARLDWLSARFVSRFGDLPLLSLKLVGVGACRSAFPPPATNLFLADSLSGTRTSLYLLTYYIR